MEPNEEQLLRAGISPGQMKARRDEQKKEEHKIKLARHKVGKSYIRLFGNEPDKRTADQKAVVDNLRQVCCANQTTAMQKPDGTIDPNMSLILEGRRQIFIHLESIMEFADQPPPVLQI
jgi:hypothetical protein